MTMIRIISTPNTIGGKKRIQGTRIAVASIAAYFLHGYTSADVKRDYPHLTQAQIEAARHYVARHPGEFGLGATEKASPTISL